MMNPAKTYFLALLATSAIGCQGDMVKGGDVGAPVPASRPTEPSVSSVVVPPAVQNVPSSSPPITGAGEQATNVDPSAFTEKLGQTGMVDWTKGVVTASGIGFGPPDKLNSLQSRLLARRAAQSVAYRNLLEAFTAIRVDSTTIVKNYVSSSDEIHVKVQGMVEDAQIVHERELEKGGYEVTLRMKLTGQTSQMFAPKDAPPPTRLGSDPLPGGQSKRATHYTGLVIDARGMEARPALVPRILTEDGQEAYSQSYVLAKYRQKEGIAAYVSDPGSAKIHPKVTDNPLYVKALRLAGKSSTDIVISNAAAQTIHGVKDHFEFLEKGQVIVVVDRVGQNDSMR